MADTKLSALTELAATPANDDEVYIRDVSEVAALESKRITLVNLLASAILKAGGTMTGDLSIERDTPALYLKDTAANGEDWRIDAWVFSNISWLRITNMTTGESIYINDDCKLEIQQELLVVSHAAHSDAAPSIFLEYLEPGLKFGRLAYNATDFVFTMSSGGGILLQAGMKIKYPAHPGSDHSSGGTSTLMTAGTALVLPQAVYVGADGKMEKALATGAATMPAIALATGTIAEDDEGEFLTWGFFRDDTWNWTPGGFLYISKDTAGALTQTLPAATGEQVQIIGVATHADRIYFSPSLELVEIS